MARLADKVAVVAGAGSIGPGWGNGKAASILFAREGAQVVCADVNPAAAEETAALIREEGGEAIAVRCDVTSEDEVASLMARAVETYGRIDVLNNNVGIAEVGGVTDLSEEKWDFVHNVNLKSAFLAMKHAIPVMQKQGSGSIVNISSIAGIRYTGVPYATYYSTKAALNHLTRTTARQYAGDHIRVNAVLPGLMKTPMVAAAVGLVDQYGEGDVEQTWAARDAQCPMGHMGDAWDVAYAVLFLASDEAKYVTGIELVVDGGITLGYTTG